MTDSTRDTSASNASASNASAALNRRPIKTRSSQLARRLAAWLAGTSVTPNQISVASIGFALAAAASLLWLPGSPGLVLCAIGIQLRLLCNLLDGMVAVEGGKGSALGALYNEIPDRVTDVVLIAALGYAIGVPWLGWLGAVAAVATAYVRLLGGALGFAQDFRGPLAKSQRMAVMTAGCLIGVVEQMLGGTQYALLTASVLIAAGALVTCVTRVLEIGRRLRAPG